MSCDYREMEVALSTAADRGNPFFLLTGPGKLPGFGQRAQGRVPIGSKAPYRKEISKMRYFVAPEGWLDEQGSLKAMFTSPVGLA